MKTIECITSSIMSAMGSPHIEAIGRLNLEKNSVGRILLIAASFAAFAFVGKTAFTALVALFKQVRNVIAVVRDKLKTARAATEDRKPLPARIRETMQLVNEAIRASTLSNRWRYATPWYLVIGDDSGVIGSLDADRRKVIQMKERVMEGPGIKWRFFNSAVIVQPEKDAAGESAEGADAWDALLSALMRYRPERPVDGIMLMLDAGRLLGSREAQLGEAADAVYRRLWKLEKICGFTVPVYAVATGCEAIAGFSEFWSLYDDKRRKEIFGWSSPFPPGAIFSPEWVDSAFEEMRGALINAQTVTAAAAVADDMNDDAYFLFPRRFQEMKTALKKYLSVLFEKSAFHPSCFLRGIYFTGRCCRRDETAPRSGDDFVGVDDLFDKKIVAEKNLAFFTDTALFSRNHLIKKIQFGLIFGFIILIAGLTTNAVQLHRHLNAFEKSLRIIRDNRIAPGDSAVIYQLLSSISAMNPRAVFPFLPCSWFDRNQEEATAYVADTAFGGIILPILSADIEKRARQVLAFPDVDDKNPVVSLISVMDRVEEFEENVERFLYISDTVPPSSTDTLPLGGKRPPIMLELSLLLRYLYGRNLPIEMIQKRGMHHQALERVGYASRFAPSMTEYHPVSDRNRLVAAFIPAPTRFVDLIFRTADSVEKLLIASVQLSPETKKSLDKFLSGSTENMEGIKNPDQVIREIGNWFGGIDESWIDKPRERTPSGKISLHWNEVKARLACYGYSFTENENPAASMIEARCCDKVTNSILASRFPPYARLFYKDADDRIQIDGTIKDEFTAWRKLNSLSFMTLQARKEEPIYEKPEAWDRGKLEQILAYCNEYQKFLDSTRADTLRKMPVICRIARKQLKSVIGELLMKAQITDYDARPPRNGSVAASDKENRLSAAVDNIAETGGLLFELLEVLDRFRFLDIHAGLSAMCAAFATDILEQADDLVRRAYSFDRSPTWDNRPYASILFGIKEKEDVKEYLAGQRKRMIDVAEKFAGPAMTLVRNTSDPGTMDGIDVLSRWRQTLEQIDRYQRGDPDNTVAKLEEYFTSFLAATAPTDAAARSATPKDFAGRFDHFSAAVQKIGERISSYRQTHGEALWEKRYALLAEKFNKQLAGRFPFCGGDESAGEASIDAAHQFFTGFTPVIDTLLEQMKLLPDNDDRYKKAASFIEDLNGAAGFFRYNLSKISNETSPVSIRARFRIRQKESPGTNQIIVWRLKSDRLLAEYPDSISTVEWEFGQPFIFELQWAFNSPFKPYPASSAGDRHIDVDGKRIAYRYEGDWALFRLLKDCMTNRFPAAQSSDNSKVVCKFDVPIKPVKAGTWDGDEPSACRAFLGMELLGTDAETKETKRIRFPAKFPAYAPELKKGTSR